MKPLPLTTAQRIAVIRTDHIGDLILSTPFLKALRQAAPQAQLEVVLPQYTAPVLENLDFVDSILSYSDRPSREFTEARLQRQYDIAVALAPRSPAYKLAYATKAPCRVGYFYASRPLTAIMCTALYLTHYMSVNLGKKLALGQPLPHEVQQLGELAKAMGLIYEDDSLSLKLSLEEEALSHEMSKNWRHPVILLQLHHNWLTLGWTVNNLVRLVSGLLMTSRGGELVVCYYGQREGEIAQELRETLASGHPKPEAAHNRIHFRGDLNFRQWACLMQGVNFVVTPDTGAVHLAAALKKPVVAVYESQTAALNTQQWAPWQVAHRSIVKDAPAPTLEKIFTALDTLMTDSLAWECSALQSSGEMEALEPPEEEGTGIGGK